MFDNIHLIIIGTDPQSGRGGIANALPGYFYALKQADISFNFVPTHHASAKGGKWLYWLKAFTLIFQEIRSAKHLEKKAVLYVHVGGGIISFFRKTTIAAFAQLQGCPVAMQIHSAKIAELLNRPLGKIIFNTMVLSASSLCVLTPWWKELMITSGVTKPLFIIPNPLEKKWEQIAHIPKPTPKHLEELNILTMTRIEQGKGVELVIEALLYLPNHIRLIIAGDGTLLPTIRERVKVLKLSHRVDFTGWVDNEQKLSLLQNTDIFCLPSSNDSFGMGFIEAMAHGLPIVALDWGPISDVVADELCGILIKQAESRQLAQAILELANHPNKRKTMGSYAQQWILEKFQAKTIGKEIGKAMLAIS